MSDIDVRRAPPGSSGGESPGEGNVTLLSLFEFTIGKINIDEGRVRLDEGDPATLDLGTLDDCLR